MKPDEPLEWTEKERTMFSKQYQIRQRPPAYRDRKQPGSARRGLGCITLTLLLLTAAAAAFYLGAK